MRISIVLALLVSFTIIESHSQTIKLNQIGFYPSEQKFAIAPTSSSTFEVINVSNSQVAYSGDLSASSTWDMSGESVKLADFSAFKDEGSYYVKIAGLSNSYSFEIKENVHRDVLKGLLKAYYFNRASTALTAEFAGVYVRQLGHPDTKVYIHKSAAGPNRPAGSTISAPKGWYDAGDYGKYIVNSGISTYTILATYEHFSELFDTLNTNIPESENDVPDILDEAKWNLDWMLAMQDTNDGGVYHKLTTLKFTSLDDMPSDATEDRYVVMKGTAATLDFTAVMAQASRIFAKYETAFPGFSAKCLAASKSAWNWASNNPNVVYKQPTDVSTGGYGDSNFSDEFDWAAAELYITTSDNQYYTATNLIASSISTPGWSDVSGLAWMSLAYHLDDLTSAANKNTIKNKVVTHANGLMDQYNNSAYGVTTKDFYWGSNSSFANEGLMLIQAFRLTNDSSYLNAALSNLDYILGRNAVDYCFMTGFGDKPPMNIHHRQSNADNVVAPVPGWVPGGPNPGHDDDKKGECDYYTSDLPAKSYIDKTCSYASNEIAINWNSPVVYMAAAMEFYFGKEDLVNGVSAVQESTFNVFPTISSQGFYINSREVLSYRILDLNGREITNSKYTVGQQIGVDLSKGMYIIQLIGSQKAETVRVIKE